MFDKVTFHCYIYRHLSAGCESVHIRSPIFSYETMREDVDCGGPQKSFPRHVRCVAPVTRADDDGVVSDQTILWYPLSK